MKRETKKWGVIFLLLLAVTYAPPAMAGALEPPPGEPGPTMHTLDEIYRMVKHIHYQTQCNSGLLRFYDQGDGTVLDCFTGLIWLKVGHCFGPRTWSWAMYFAGTLADGECGLHDGSKPGDWRLPTKEEWEALVDQRFSYPALCNAACMGKWSEGDAFSNVYIDRFYWSSSDYGDEAWAMEMWWGRSTEIGKIYQHCVWPVRDVLR